MDYMKALGAVIRELRKERGLSISDVHYRIRMNRQAIGEIERGEVTPKLQSILALCEALEVKPSRLFALAESRL